MPISRVITETPGLAQTQDATARAFRSIQGGLDLPYGKPTTVVRSGAHQAVYNTLVRLDPGIGGVSVLLPEIKISDVGKQITLLNVTGSDKPVMVTAPLGTVNGSPSYTITQPYFRRTFIAADTDLWVDETADLGQNGYGLPIQWFGWNGTDLSQFKAPVTGPRVSASDVSVVTKYGVTWVQITNTTNATSPNSGGEDWCLAGTVLAIAQVPPDANYTIFADVKVEQGPAASYFGAAIVARYEPGNAGYAVLLHDTIGGNFYRTMAFNNSTLKWTARDENAGEYPTSETVANRWGTIKMGVGCQYSLIYTHGTYGRPGVQSEYFAAAEQTDGPGAPAIAASCMHLNSTCTVLFRNIRCFYTDTLGLFY